MKTRVRNLTNISEVSVPVQTGPLTTVYLSKGQTITNQDVYNLPEIAGMVKTEQDLAEVNPVRESKQKLYD